MDQLHQGRESFDAITPPAPTPDEQAINAGIDAARAADREIDDATARRIASQLHGGQASALYSLASTGNIDSEHVYREIGGEYEQQRDPEVREWLNWLGTYCIRREHKGPVERWAETTADPAAVAPHDIGAVALAADLVPGAAETFEDEPDHFPWTDSARWNPHGDHEELDRQDLDDLFTRVPDEEISESGDVGMFRLVRHDGRPGGLVLSQNSHGQRRVWRANTDEELTARWAELQQEQEAFIEATSGQQGSDNYRNATMPRIWLASLSDYTNGRLYGEWLDATCDAETLQAAAIFLLRGSVEADAEEWGIFDYEGFGDLPLSEYESLETVSKLAQAIEKHGPAFAAWVSYVGVEHHEQLDRFEDHYRGEWDSLKDYVEDVLDSMSFNESLEQALSIFPEDVRNHINIDIDGLARDWGFDLHVADAPNGRVWIFDTHA